MVSINAENRTWEIEDATEQERLWIHGHSKEYVEFRVGHEIDVVFCPTADAKLEELLNMGAR